MRQVHNLTVFSDIYENNPNITLKKYCENHEQALKEQREAKEQKQIEQNRKLSSMVGKVFMINHNNSSYNLVWIDKETFDSDVQDYIIPGKPILSYLKENGAMPANFTTSRGSVQKSWLLGTCSGCVGVEEISIEIYESLILLSKQMGDVLFNKN